ncbi:hypothetical protein GO986_19380 [Deinococcus sp. HMF7620]|uniref:Uncharacterized protein n=1 Tax=Deinococcus arboris TaxID=2682977 RepID=A0A7C9I1G7_9DEIO|nr:hypothetical protein [Deinococcus arboris]MVN88908.1 hypothetical protein [Deinococcus arboris]
MKIAGRTAWNEPVFEEIGSRDRILLAHLSSLCGDLQDEDDARHISSAARTILRGYFFDTAGYILAAQGRDIVITAKYATFEASIDREELAELMTQWAGHLESSD